MGPGAGAVNSFSIFGAYPATFVGKFVHLPVLVKGQLFHGRGGQFRFRRGPAKLGIARPKHSRIFQKQGGPPRSLLAAQKAETFAGLIWPGAGLPAAVLHRIHTGAIKGSVEDLEKNHTPSCDLDWLGRRQNKAPSHKSHPGKELSPRRAKRWKKMGKGKAGGKGRQPSGGGDCFSRRKQKSGDDDFVKGTGPRWPRKVCEWAALFTIFPPAKAAPPAPSGYRDAPRATPRLIGGPFMGTKDGHSGGKPSPGGGRAPKNTPRIPLKARKLD